MSGGVVCPRCGTVNPDAARFCSNCGLERPAAQQPAAAPIPWTPPPAAAKKSHAGRNFLIFMGVIAAIFVVGLIWKPTTGSRGSGSGSGGGGTGGGTTSNWVAPSGFTLYDESTAFRWDDTGDCIIGGCWHMTLVTLNGCPNSLYVELTTLSSGGTVVGYTNDTVGELKAGEQAKLNFENPDKADKARISKVSCY